MANPYSTDQVADLIAPALGQARARAAVHAAARRLGLVSSPFRRDQVLELLDCLGTFPGLEGISARVAKTRFEQASTATPRRGVTSARRSSRPPRPPSAGNHSIAALVELLASAVGQAKAEEAIRAETKTRGFAEPLTTEQALDVMEHLGAQPGIIGIAARFGKARLLLPPVARSR